MFWHEKPQHLLFAKRTHTQCRNYGTIDAPGYSDNRTAAVQLTKNLFA
jgi:hypothetical protein